MVTSTHCLICNITLSAKFSPASENSNVSSHSESVKKPYNNNLTCQQKLRVSIVLSTAPHNVLVSMNMNIISQQMVGSTYCINPQAVEIAFELLPVLCLQMTEMTENTSGGFSSVIKVLV